MTSNFSMFVLLLYENENSSRGIFKCHSIKKAKRISIFNRQKDTVLNLVIFMFKSSVVAIASQEFHVYELL